MDYVTERTRRIGQRVPFSYMAVEKMVKAGLTDSEIELAAQLGLSEKWRIVPDGPNFLEIYTSNVAQLKMEKLLETVRKNADRYARQRGRIYYWLYYRSLSPILHFAIRWVHKVRRIM